MRKSPRDRRLSADLRSVEKLSAESSIFSFLAKGDLPQRYSLIFDGMGISRDSAGKIVPTSHHEIVVELGAAYPRMVPNLAWQTPIFHPNISNNGIVCLGGYGTHWVPSLTLAEMCTMLWDMIRYKNFDIASPYNRQAALWAQSQTHFQFPIDGRPIRNLIADPNTGSKSQSTADQPSPTHWTKRIPLIGNLRAASRRSEHVPSSNGVADNTMESESSSPVNVSSVNVVAVEVVGAGSSDDEASVVEAVEVASDNGNEPENSKVQFIDPSEIEVIIPGIQIISSNLDGDPTSTSPATPVAQESPAPSAPSETEPDNGIIFLD